MHSRLGLLVIGATMATAGAASASVITVTQPLSISTGSLNGGGVNFNTPDFNTSLGTLTGITLQFTGTVQDQALFEEGAPEGGTFTAVNSASLNAGGFPLFTTYNLASGTFMFNAGAPSALSSTTNVSFTAAVPAAALSEYTTGLPPGYETSTVFFGFNIFDSHGDKVGVSDGETKFVGQLLETYTYTPLPEPGTVALVAFGMLTLLGVRRASRPGAR